MHRVPARLICGCALLAAALHAQADEAWRVVVQDANAKVLAVSADGTLAAALDVQAVHVFHVLDLQLSQVRLTVRLPDRIVSAALAPNGRLAIVSAGRKIFRVDLAAGQPEVLLDGCTGQIAVNADGTQLAVAGWLDSIDEKRVGEKELPSIDDDGELEFGVKSPAGIGLYDLAGKKWLHRVAARIPQIQAVAFDGRKVVVQGYTEGNRAEGGVACDFTFDPASGKVTARYDKSRDGFGSKVKNERPDEPAYEIPKCIAVAQESVRETHDLVSKTRAFSGSLGEPGQVVGPEARYDRRVTLSEGKNHVSMLVDRGEGRCGIVSVSRDGTIDLQPTLDVYGKQVGVVEERFLAFVFAQPASSFIDLHDAKMLFDIPGFDVNLIRDRVYFDNNGIFVVQSNHLSRYRADNAKPVWSREIDVDGRFRAAPLVSPDGRFIAINLNRSPDTAIILSMKTGEITTRIARPVGDSQGYGLSTAFSHDGERLAIIGWKDIYIYDVASGELVMQRKRGSFVKIAPAGAHWLLGGSSKSAFLKNDGTLGHEIALSEILATSEIAVAGQLALLVETKSGLGGIVDPVTGKILAQWGFDDPDPNFRPGAPRAAAAFDGKIIARREGTGDLHLIDLKNLSPLLTVHVIPMAKRLEWIAYTPDGYWTASDGAAEHVLIFQGLHRATAEEKLARRDPERIRTRIAAALE